MLSILNKRDLLRIILITIILSTILLSKSFSSETEKEIRDKVIKFAKSEILRKTKIKNIETFEFGIIHHKIINENKSEWYARGRKEATDRPGGSYTLDVLRIVSIKENEDLKFKIENSYPKKDVYNTKILKESLEVEVDLSELKLHTKGIIILEKKDFKFPFLVFKLSNKHRLNFIKYKDKNINYTHFGNEVFIPIGQFKLNENIFKLEISYFYINEKIKERQISFNLSELINRKRVFLKFGFCVPYNDKVIFPDTEVSVNYILPENYGRNLTLVSSKGELLKTKERSNKIEFLWDHGKFVDSVPFVIGNYEIFQRKFNNIEITAYLFPDSVNKAGKIINLTYKTFNYFTNLYCRLPLSRIYLVEYPHNNIFISSESKGLNSRLNMIMLKNEITDSIDEIDSVRTIAHEIAHFWFNTTRDIYQGDRRNLGDAWLDEGFAEYSAILFLNSEVEPFYKKHLCYQNLEYLKQIEKFGTDPPITSLRTDPEKEKMGIEVILYSKGSFILSMLRNIVGDEKFIMILRLYLERYKDKDTTISDFKKACEEVHQKNLNWFFNQWFYKTGAPKFDLKDIEVNETKGGYKVKAILYQDGDIFKCPVEVELITFDEERKREIFMISKKERPIFFKCKSKPKSLIVDPDWKILKFDNHVIVPLYEKQEEIDLSDAPFLGEGFYNLAKEYFEKKEYDTAEYWIKEAIKINPNYTELYNMLGAIYMEKKMYDEAIEQFKKAIEIDSNYITARNNLANAYTKKGLIIDGIMEYEKSFIIDPNDEDTYLGLGSLYMSETIDKNLYDQAVFLFKRALRINPDRGTAYFLLGAAYAGKEKYDEAINNFKEVLRLEPENSASIFHIGICYGNKGEKEEAVEWFEKYIELNLSDEKTEQAKEFIKKLKGE